MDRWREKPEPIVTWRYRFGRIADTRKRFSNRASGSCPSLFSSTPKLASVVNISESRYIYIYIHARRRIPRRALSTYECHTTSGYGLFVPHELKAQIAQMVRSTQNCHFTAHYVVIVAFFVEIQFVNEFRVVCVFVQHFYHAYAVKDEGPVTITGSERTTLENGLR